MKPTTVRCKFTCYQNDTIPNGSENVHNIKLHAVYDPTNEENMKFWKYTPSGNFEMQCVNEEASTVFEVGKQYYIDITEA